MQCNTRVSEMPRRGGGKGGGGTEHRSKTDQSIGLNMLERFRRIFLVEITVIMMMMTLIEQVHRRMRPVRRAEKHESLAREHDLPEQTERQQEDGREATRHAADATTGFSPCLRDGLVGGRRLPWGRTRPRHSFQPEA